MTSNAGARCIWRADIRICRKGFSGHLHADGYQGYHKLPENIRVVGCWAHARRKFDEALNAIPPDKQVDSAALAGLQYCNKLFAWKKQFETLDPEEETAKENGLDPYGYLVRVLAQAPGLAAESEGPGWAARIVPANAPSVCRICQSTT